MSSKPKGPTSVSRMQLLRTGHEILETMVSGAFAINGDVYFGRLTTQETKERERRIKERSSPTARNVLYTRAIFSEISFATVFNLIERGEVPLGVVFVNYVVLPQPGQEDEG